MFQLGMCCIVKDEAPFLEEWLLFHTFVGVERFIIYDNGSRIPVEDTLRPYIRKNFLTVHRVFGKARQTACYDDCLKEYGSSMDWLAVVDMDEFIVPRHIDDLRVLLKAYDRFGGLALNWKVFGTNGHQKRPQGLQIENYTRWLAHSDEQSRHVKVIVRPACTSRFLNPHMPILHTNVVVNECSEMVVSPYSEPPSWELGQVNHYYYRSLQDYYQKLQRGMADSGKPHRIPRKVTAPEGDTEDLLALRFAPRILRAMAGLPWR